MSCITIDTVNGVSLYDIYVVILMTKTKQKTAAVAKKMK